MRMNGRICLVTGSTHGIGLSTAKVLGALGATVLVHGRDGARAREVAASLSRDTCNANVRSVQADFAQLAQVRRLALSRLDVLINNAAVLGARGAHSADGYDLTFAVNHLAPFLLTNLLLDKMRQSGPSRIVVVASEAHRRATLDFGDLMNTKVSGFLTPYQRSKLANLLFARALARRLAGSGVTVNALHPGLVRSHLFRNSPTLLRVLLSSFGRVFMLSPQQGARGSVYLAAAPELDGQSGGYYHGCRRVAPRGVAERAVSRHPNFVTPRGHAAIEARVRELEGERQAARESGDAAARAHVERDLRYWSARRASARVIGPAAVVERVRFGMRVTLQLRGGSTQTFRLVGEDEADATHGLLSWVAPLAQSLLGKQVGDSVPFQGGEVLIVSIEP